MTRCPENLQFSVSAIGVASAAGGDDENRQIYMRELEPIGQVHAWMDGQRTYQQIGATEGGMSR